MQSRTFHSYISCPYCPIVLRQFGVVVVVVVKDFIEFTVGWKVFCKLLKKKITNTGCYIVIERCVKSNDVSVTSSFIAYIYGIVSIVTIALVTDIWFLLWVVFVTSFL